MDVVVVGAGIAGLAAAHRVRQLAPHARVTIVEAAGKIGGKLATSPVGEVAVDEGAEAFLARAPEGAGLITAAGLADQVIDPATTAASVLVAGAPRRLPPDTVMGVPAGAASIEEFLGVAAAKAVAEEPEHPGAPLTGDVSVGELVARRLGRPVVDHLTDPLLGGVYAGRADELSLQATIPALYAAMRENGSLVGAASSLLPPPRPAGEQGPPIFGSLRGGMGSLPPAVLAASGATLRTGLPVREVLRSRGGFRVVAGEPGAAEIFEADAVIVAAPAAPAARMLRTAAPIAATELAGIDYAGVGLVTLVLPRQELPAGSGLLVPAVAGRAVKAVTYLDAKWPQLLDGSTGLSVVRASVGRHREEQLLERDDADLVRLVRAELAELIGISATPVATRVTRWPAALPQYAVGHVDRVGRVQRAVAAVPGLAVCGAAYAGVGIPACIRSGQQAAEQVLAAVAAAGDGDGASASAGAGAGAEVADPVRGAPEQRGQSQHG